MGPVLDYQTATTAEKSEFIKDCRQRIVEGNISHEMALILRECISAIHRDQPENQANLLTILPLLESKTQTESFSYQIIQDLVVHGTESEFRKVNQI